MEEWKKLERFRRLEVSNLGNVRTVWTHKTKQLKPMQMKTSVGSYLKVSVTEVTTGKQIQIGIHNLVSEAFIEKHQSSEKLEPNHIDGDKQNNAVNNLEWTTRSENLKHAYKSGLKTITGRTGKFEIDKSKPVKAVEIATQKVYQTKSAKAMSDVTGIPARTISYNAFERKETKPVKGFLFYEDK